MAPIISGPRPQKVPLLFRNHLHQTEEKHYSKAWAFSFKSPDIIPHYGKGISVDSLKSSYDDFISFPIQPNDFNNVYIRAFAPEIPIQSTAVTLRAVPNELILWPQVWNKAPILPTGPVVIAADGTADAPVASEEHFVVRPPTLGGFSYALIAVAEGLLPTKQKNPTNNLRLRDTLTVPRDTPNWREYVKFIDSDQSTSYYNVRVTDPTSPCVSMTTRLRLFEDDPDTKSLEIILQVEHAGLDPDTQISLSSDHGEFVLERTNIGDSHHVIGSDNTIPSDYDGFITLNIFPPAGKCFRNAGWISLQAQILSPPDPDTGMSKTVLLGAENIVFNANRTRRARFYSQAAVALQAANRKKTAGSKLSLNAANTTSSPQWWFRDQIGDTNSFPRTGMGYHSPGTGPLSDPVGTLGGGQANTDYTDDNNINVISGDSNYIYLRGNCVKANSHIKSRLFVMPNNVLLAPQTYSRYGVLTPGGDGMQISEIKTTADNSFNVLNPFVLTNLPSLSGQGDHYCAVAETILVRDGRPDPDWPSEQVDLFATGEDMSLWIRNTPQVAQRNIGYSLVTADEGGPAFIKNVTLKIPPSPDAGTLQYTLSIVNQDKVDPNSEISLSATVQPPKGSIGFEKVSPFCLPPLYPDIKTANPYPQEKVAAGTGALHGSVFSGIDPDNGFETIITIKWYPDGTTVPPQVSFQVKFYSEELPDTSTDEDDAAFQVRERKSVVSVCDFHPGLPKYITPNGHRPLVAPLKGTGNHVVVKQKGRRRQMKEVSAAEVVTIRADLQPTFRAAIGADKWLCKNDD
ncbi:hypothetical protein HYDPIDRAFT_28856 [Hydnomerulius pinastri MD-312]|uniref:Uncharacterized protein n=1 Tax=Hydnomerulius pinastri MD-312 TaxID=994086 RepID=A0A0C9VZS2_9AGAM|nr:hypothetical protein HYDPIDRAFT_28856 [Hydnomerulius pinastri MD-312]